mmetsp:Transcript_14581/g.47612  ORF Transcript_14581/g.47612 Transcript_14581/m.47612 type:complete len:242 (-) Transcript_14581:779-1504(-)
MPALRPGGKGSLRARVKAGMSTRSRSAGSRYCAILPRQIVVLVRMAASSSSCSLAKARITSPSVARDSLGASGTTLLTVSSRSTGEVSAKPSETCPKMDSLMVRWVRWGISWGSVLSSGMRMARSVLANSLTTVGTTCACISSSLSTVAMVRSGSSALAEAPPYSSELVRAGSTFHCAAGLGMAGTRSASLVKKRSFSTESLTLSISRNRCSETYASSKSGFCSSSIGRRRWAVLADSRRM